MKKERVIFHDEPLPTSETPGSFAWAMEVRRSIQKLLKKHKADRVEFVGFPADQWKMCCAVFNEMSEQSRRD